MTIIYRTTFVQFYLNSQGNTLEIEWLDFANSEQLRSALTEALRLSRQHRAKNMVSNNLKMRTIRPADQDWMVEVWFPEFAKLGMERLALVDSEDALNQVGFKDILERAADYLPRNKQQFATAPEARRWAAQAAYDELVP